MQKFGVILERERGSLFYTLPILLAAGIGFYFSLPTEPHPHWLFVPLVPAVFLLLALKYQSGHYHLLLLGLILSVSLGFSTAKVREIHVTAPILQERTYTTLSATVLHVELDKKAPRVLLAPLKAENSMIESLAKVRLTVRTKMDAIAPGDTINVKGVFLPPPAPVYPGAYDFQRDLYFKQIGAVGYATSAVEIIKKGSALIDTEGIRHRIAKEIDQNAPIDQAGFLLAIMVGEKSQLSEDLKEDMRHSGLAHLLAISGLHMMMLGGAIFFMIRLLLSCIPVIALNYPIKKIAACIAILAVSCYLAVSGLSVSAVRAYLMISLVFLAVCFDRQAISLRNLGVAAILILILLPESLMGASFQMSFAAVFCLIAVYEKWGEAFFVLHGKSHFVFRPILYLLGVALTSLIASVATAPFSIHHFGQLAVAGIVTNLIAIPFMGFWVMPLAIFGFLLMPFGLSAGALTLSAAGVSGIMDVANWGANFPYASLQIAPFSTEVIVLLSLATICYLILRTQVKYIAFILLFMALFIRAEQKFPDILISESGKLLLINPDDGPLINSARYDRFERDRWQVLYGISNVSTFRGDQLFSKVQGHCDPLGCSWIQKEQRITYSLVEKSHHLDCKLATILIATDPIKSACRKPALKIDFFDLWRQGAHAIYLNTEKPRLLTVNGVRGDRPWVRDVGRSSSGRVED